LTFGDEILADTANSAVQKGDLAISWGADDRNGSGNIDRSVSFGSFAAPANLTSDGQTITYSFNSDKTVLTASAGPGHTVIFTVSLSDSGSGEYTFRLYGNIDHATDSKTLDFGFVARDADGDAVTGTISVDILDGGPQIGNVENETVNESALPTDLIDVILADTPYSTVQVGNLAVDWGADSNNSGVSNNRSLAFSGIVNGASSGLTHDGVAIVYTLSQNNTVLTAKAGGTEIFTVSLSDDGTGSYTFVLKDSIDHTSGNGTSATLSFGFTATDSDGDAAKSSFSVSIIDDTPEAHTPSIRTLEEASGSPAISNVSLGIDWKSDDGPARDVRFTNLSTAAANISNAASLTSSGQPLSYALIAGILVAYIGSQPADAHADNVVFSVALSKDGSGAYSFTLNQPLDQTSSISGNDHFTDITVSYSAIDSDGDADKASFTVRVDAAGVISNQNHDISYADLTSGVFVNLDNSAATYAGQTVGADKATDTSAVTDKVVGIDNVGGIVNVTGSKGSDVIIGGAEDNVLKGGAGNDIIDGRGGTDKLYGEDGDDRLIGGAGNDVLDGGTNTTVGFTVPVTPTSDGAAAILASVHGGDTADYSGSSVNIIANLGDAANWPVTIGAHQATGEGTDTLNGIESVAGGSGDDVIFGDGSANILVGGAGSDNIFGGAGNDLLYGGDDTVGDGLFAGAGDDVIILGNGGGTAKGEGGNDLIYGGTGNDYLYGEDDGNPNTADAGNDTIFAGAGNDYIEGDGGNDKLYGEDGNDTIVGGAGNDTIDGGAGDDTIVYALGDGADIVDGGIGNDTLKVTTPNGGPTLIEYISASGGNLLLSPTDSTIANLEVEKTLTARNVETLDIDVTGNNWLVFGQNGSDLASSGLQTVKITGDDNGNSVYFSNVSSATKLEASLNGGNDSFVAGGQAINQQVDGGSGVDLFNFSQISQQLNIDLAAGTAIRSSLNGATVIATDAITNFENVTGSVGNDTILGTDGANVLSGGDVNSAGTGNDIINGRGGDDIIDGGDGNDTLEGGTGSDTLYGGAGNDTFILGTDVIGSGTRVLDLGNGTFQTVSIDGLAGTADVVSGGTGYDKIVLDAGSASGYVHDTYSATGYISGVEEITGTSGNDVIMVASSYQSDAAGGGITIDGGAGNDAIGGGAGNDTLLGGDGDDLISGLSGDDTLEGGAGNDTLYGGTGNDILRGGADNDVMYGGDGVDRLDGGAGNDILIGGKGDDALIGGAGNDLFKYTVGDGNDRINGGSEAGTEAPNYDILEITGDAEQRSFTIGQLAQASAGNIAPYPAETDLNDVTVSYTGTDTATIRADEIERIVINTGSAGDTVTVGDLTGTAIAPATIVINSGSGSDTIDLTALAGTRVEINDADPSGSGDIDTVKLAGHWTDYTVTQAPDGTFAIARGDTVIATAKNIEQFQFAADVSQAHDGIVSAADLLNDAPKAVADTASVTEAGGVNNGTDGVAQAQGNVLANDTDVDAYDTKVVTQVGSTTVASTGETVVNGTYGALTIHADGSYTYALNNGAEATQKLGATDTAHDVFSYVVTDAHGLTSSSSLDVTVNGSNDVTVVDLNGSANGRDVSTTAVEQLGQQFASQATLSDIDSSTLQSMTLTLAHNLDGTAETLSLNAVATAAAAGLTVSYTNGALSITGSASVGTYQKILQNVVYTNTSDNPDASIDRTVTVVVNDGHDNSAAQIATIKVQPINDAPALAGTLAAHVTEGLSHILTSAELGHTDPDNTASQVVFQVSSLTHGTITNGGAPATSFTAAELAAGKIAFVHDGSEGSTASFQVKVEDGNQDNSVPTASTFNFTVDAVNEGKAALSISDTTQQASAPKVGDILHANLGNDPDGAATGVTYHWLRDGADTGNTGVDYTLVAADAGHALTVKATYTDGQNFAETVTSAETATVVSANHAPVAGNDIIITNDSSISIPDWVLLLNDKDTDGNALKITGVSNAGWDDVSHAANATSVTFEDAWYASAGGSFDYSVSDGAASANAHVEVDYQSTFWGQAVTGTSADEILIGSNSSETLIGNGGQDVIVANGGNDTIVGDQSDFLLDGGSGTDTMQVGANFTSTSDVQIANIEKVSLTSAVTLDLSNQTEAFTITGSSGADRITGGAGDDTIVGAQNDALLNGGGGSDTLQIGANFTSSSNAQIVNVEKVELTAAATLNLANQTENFVVVGSSNSDTITTGSGDDTLVGSGGYDSLTGGLGHNTFVLDGSTAGSYDVITDFVSSKDILNLINFSLANHSGTGAISSVVTVDSDKLGSGSGETSIAGADLVVFNINANSADTATEINALLDNQRGTFHGGVFVLAYSDVAGANRVSLYYDSDANGTGGGATLVAVFTNYGNVTAAGVPNIAADFASITSAIDPIILDLDHNGIALTTLDNGVSFDINADGHQDKIAWTAGTDGILAYDVDGNGKIDNGSEIFSPHFAGGSYVDGLAALATLDSNHDGKIDANDEAFSKLTIWQDLNHNGISDAGELSSLADHQIASLSLDASASNTDINGQSVLADGSYTLTDGSAGHFVEVAFDTALGGSDDHAYALIGSDGDDILSGAGGMYTLTGGAGADTFVLDTNALADVKLADVITDYKAGEGDTLDVSKLLDSLLGHEATEAEALSSVKTTVTGADTTVSVNANGGWHDVAVLQNTTEAVKILFDDKHDAVTAPHVG
jgi:T1SS-143 domain-containing protein